jgi:hypothetical protein
MLNANERTDMLVITYSPAEGIKGKCDGTELTVQPLENGYLLAVTDHKEWKAGTLFKGSIRNRGKAVNISLDRCLLKPIVTSEAKKSVITKLKFNDSSRTRGILSKAGCRYKLDLVDKLHGHKKSV